MKKTLSQVEERKMSGEENHEGRVNAIGRSGENEKRKT